MPLDDPCARHRDDVMRAPVLEAERHWKPTTTSSRVEAELSRDDGHATCREVEQRLREANRRLQAEGPALERDKLIVQLRAEIERLRGELQRERADCDETADELMDLKTHTAKLLEAFEACRAHLLRRHGCNNFADFNVKTCEWPKDHADALSE